jgi:hypothetical protein
VNQVTSQQRKWIMKRNYIAMADYSNILNRLQNLVGAAEFHLQQSPSTVADDLDRLSGEIRKISRELFGNI